MQPSSDRGGKDGPSRTFAYCTTGAPVEVCRFRHRRVSAHRLTGIARETASDVRLPRRGARARAAAERQRGRVASALVDMFTTPGCGWQTLREAASHPTGQCGRGGSGVPWRVSTRRAMPRPWTFVQVCATTPRFARCVPTRPFPSDVFGGRSAQMSTRSLQGHKQRS